MNSVDSTACECTYSDGVCTKCHYEKQWTPDFYMDTVSPVKILGWMSETQMIYCKISYSGGKNYLEGEPQVMVLRDFWENFKKGFITLKKDGGT